MTFEPVELQSDVSVPEIDGFEILSIAGRGGMGIVYKARQIAFDRIVAIKLLHKHLTGNGATTVQRFIQEGRLATQLQHPNIGAVLGSGSTGDNQPYLVMEFLEGESLRDEIERNGPLDRASFKDYFAQIIAALQCAHELKIIHRDLKPGNIVLEIENGRKVPKLVDFGIAKLLEMNKEEVQKLTQTGSLIGSPTYMSPEQFGFGEVDARSDIYSLGCVMYEAITGKLVFDGDNVMELMAQHIGESPMPPSMVSPGKLPAGVDEIILKMLAKQPADRYQNCAEVLSDLECIDLASTASAVKPSQTLKKVSPRKRNASKVAFGAAALALALCIGIGWISKDEATRDLYAARKAFDASDFRAASEYLLSAGMGASKLSEDQKIELAIAAYELAQLLYEEPQSKREMQNVTQALEQVSSTESARLLTRKLELEHLHRERRFPEISMNLMPKGSGQSIEVVRTLMLCERALKEQEQGSPDAVQTFKKALDAAKLADRPDLRMQVWHAMANYYGGLHDYEAAEVCMGEGLRLGPQAKRRPTCLTVRALMNLALQARTLEDWESTQRALDLASTIGEHLKLPPGIRADMLSIEGELLRHQQDYKGAIAKYAEEAKVRDSFMRPTTPLMTVHQRLGQVYEKLGDKEKASEEFRRSAEIVERMSDSYDGKFDLQMSLASKIGTIGLTKPAKAKDLARSLGDEYRAAIGSYEGQLVLDPPRLLEPLFNKNFSESLRRALVISIQLKNFEDAETYALRRLEVNRAVNDSAEEAYTLRALFDIQSNLNRPAEALPHLEQSVEMYRRVLKPQDRTLLETETKLAGIYFRTRTYDKAEPLLRKIISDSSSNKALRRGVISTAPLTLARICATTGRKEEAWQLLHDNIQHADEEFGAKQRPVVEKAHELYDQLSASRNRH